MGVCYCLVSKSVQLMSIWAGGWESRRSRGRWEQRDGGGGTKQRECVIWWEEGGGWVLGRRGSGDLSPSHEAGPIILHQYNQYYKIQTNKITTPTIHWLFVKCVIYCVNYIIQYTDTIYL